jgi:hypothetical protein
MLWSACPTVLRDGRPRTQFTRTWPHGHVHRSLGAPLHTRRNALPEPEEVGRVIRTLHRNEPRKV